MLAWDHAGQVSGYAESCGSGYGRCFPRFALAGPAQILFICEHTSAEVMARRTSAIAERGEEAIRQTARKSRLLRLLRALGEGVVHNASGVLL